MLLEIFMKVVGFVITKEGLESSTTRMVVCLLDNFLEIKKLLREFVLLRKGI